MQHTAEEFLMDTQSLPNPSPVPHSSFPQTQPHTSASDHHPTLLQFSSEALLWLPNTCFMARLLQQHVAEGGRQALGLFPSTCYQHSPQPQVLLSYLGSSTSPTGSLIYQKVLLPWSKITSTQVLNWIDSRSRINRGQHWLLHLPVPASAKPWLWRWGNFWCKKPLDWLNCSIKLHSTDQYLWETTVTRK